MSSKITDISYAPCLDSKFIEPKRMYYTQSGVKKTWDYIDSCSSVSVILYHKEFDSLLFVSQFRPAVFVNNADLNGYTYELCAGLVDKDKNLESIVIEEIEEECGYRVEDIELVTSFYGNAGISGAKQSMFYAEIDESKRVGDGGGIEEEEIELIFVKVKDLKDFMFDISKAKAPSVILGIFWFLEFKYKKI